MELLGQTVYTVLTSTEQIPFYFVFSFSLTKVKNYFILHAPRCHCHSPNTTLLPKKMMNQVAHP
jgi:hypothetical protein